MDTFLTVSKSSSNRALDMPASYVSTLRDGEEIFIESYGRKFIWDSSFPSGSSTVDGESFRPLSWSSNGAFVADLFGGEKFWRQSAWFVSTLGDDENDGLTALTPLKTDSEIQRRWGVGRRARLSSAVTITYAQSPTTQTALYFEYVSGGSLKLVGTPTVSKSGTVLTDVQAQVRTAGSEAAWAVSATAFGATDVGKLMFITASGTPANVNASAMIVKDETGGKLRVAPFGTINETTGVITSVTPQVGDVVEIRDMTAATLLVGKIDALAMTQSAGSGGNRVWFDSIALDGGTSALGTIDSNGAVIVYARSILKSLTLQGHSGQGLTPHLIRGGGITGNGLLVRSAVSISITGCLGNVQARAGGNVTVNSDTYFQNCACVANFGGLVQSGGAAFFDRTTADSAVLVQGDGTWSQFGAVPDWGTGNAGHGVSVASTAKYSYATKPTVNGTLGAGREAEVGGTDKEYADIPYVETTNGAMLVLAAA